MLHSSAVYALAPAALLSIASAGCFVPADLARESPLVGPGSVDRGNVYLPAVMLITPIDDSEGNVVFRRCSGALIDSRVVITAAHCVCLPRAPSRQDWLSTKSSTKSVRGAIRTRAGVLRDLSIIEITDRRSSCARSSSVVTRLYRPGEAPPAQSYAYSGTVVIHPEFELIFGTTPEKWWATWNNADLAAIILDQPVPPDVQPVVLSDSEVKIGDALVMAGYGPVEIGGNDFGTRRFGGNRVTELDRLETGNVVFGAGLAPGPEYKAPAHGREGDSGGACVREDNPNVLIGIITTYRRTSDGSETTYFTSTFSQREWLSEILQRVHVGADAGVNVPGSDAGSSPSPLPTAP